MIYAVTHILKEDIEISAEVIKMPFYLLTDDFERTHGTLGGCFIELNGVVYVDKSDKADMTKSKETCINLLQNGANIMWFPEGVWNLSPNLPVLPLPFGIIKAAIRANAIILPLAIEQYGRKFIVNMGQEIDYCNIGSELENDMDFKIMAINELRDVFATLKWEIWGSQPMARRMEIAPCFWDRHVEEILNHWQHYALEEVLACVYKPKGIVNAEEVFGSIC